MRIIAGTDQTAREAVLAQEVAQALGKGGRAVLVVPEQYTLETERWAAASLRGVSRLSLEIVSFNRLGHRFVDSRRGNRRLPLDRQGHLMALQRVILNCRDQLSSYGRIAGRTGFAQEAEALLKELKLSDIRPSQLAECAARTELPEQLRVKLTDLALIYDAYEVWVATGYLDEGDRLRQLEQALLDERPYAGADIWFHGFRSFTGLEWRLIAALQQQAGTLSFALGIPDTDVTDAVYGPLRRTVGKITALSSREGAMSSVSVQNAAGGHLGDATFGLLASDAIGELPSVTAVRCATPEREAEHAAGTVLKWVQERGWRWRDIRIVTPSEPQWQTLLSRVFSQQGIPLYIDGKTPLSRHALSRYLMDLLAAALDGMRGETVCRAMKWGYSPVTRADVELLENYALTRGLRGSRWKQVEEAPPAVMEAMVWVRDVLQPFGAALGKAGNTAAVVEALAGFLTDTGVPGQLETEAAALKSEGLLLEAQVQEQVWGLLQNTLEQTSALMGDEEMTLRDFADLLRAGLESAEVGLIPPTGDQASCGTLFRSRSGSVKGLLVLGANDGKLPAYDSGDGLLLNEEKQLLVSQGLALESDRDTRGSEEEYALYDMLGMAREAMLISCSHWDDSGERLQPSWVFERLAAFGGDALPNPWGEPGPPAAFVSRVADLLRERIPLTPLQHAAVERLRTDLDWSGRIAAVEAGGEHRYQVKTLGKDRVEGIMGQTLVMNATGLERYGRCPFAWFVRYGLKPAPRKRFAIELPDMGTLFHQTVDQFMRQYGAGPWREWDQDRLSEVLMPLVDRMAADYGYGVLEDTARNRFLKRKIQRLGLRALGTLSRQLSAGSFEVVGTETAFDMRPEMNGLPPLTLSTESGGRLLVQGRIDRIDRCVLPDPVAGDSVYLRVVDYKSGRPRFSLSDFAHGLELQLAVYLDVLTHSSEAFSATGIRPAGFLYFYLDDPLVDPADDTGEALDRALFRELRMEGLLVDDLEVLTAMDAALPVDGRSDIIPVTLKQDGTPSAVSSVISGASMQALLTYAEDLIRRQGTAIQAGDFPVSPCQTEDGMACVRCDYGALCQYDPAAEESSRRVLKKMKDRQALELITGGGAHGSSLDD